MSEEEFVKLVCHCLGRHGGEAMALAEKELLCASRQ